MAATSDNIAQRLQQAIARHQSGDIAGAEQAYRHVLAVAPRQFDALHYLGVAAMQRGELERAVELLREALAQQPRHAEAWGNLGTACTFQADHKSAAQAFRRVLRLDPRSGYAADKLARAEFSLGNFRAARPAFEHALTLRPDDAALHHGHGLTLWRLGEPRHALRAWERALTLDPSHGHALSEYVFACRALCEWADINAWEGRFLKALRQGREGLSPFLCLGLTADRQVQRQCATQWARRFTSAVKEPMTHPSGLRTHRVLRIGYLSADFRQHPLAQLLAGVLERHDRKRFHVRCYSLGGDDGSGLRRRIEAGCDAFVDVHPAPAGEVARRIAGDRVDVLVDLMGYTHGAEVGVLVRRPAPVQVSWLGYPGTLGAPLADYLIADKVVIPDAHRGDYCEAVVRLPVCYQANDDRRALPERQLTRRDCGLPESGFVFCNFNQNWKLSPAQFAVWMEILKAAPGSVLWLLEGISSQGVGSRLKDYAGQYGVDGARIVLAPHRPVDGYLDQYRLADLFLDTQPYNAHTTASEALFMGCPVLTQRGTSFAGRVAASLLHACGLAESVARSPGDYCRMALACARNPEIAAGWRRRLEAERSAAPLFDTARFTGELEQAFTRMAQAGRRGRAPESFDV